MGSLATVATVRVTEDGAIELPHSLLEAHGWTSGTELEVVVVGDEVILRESHEALPTTTAARGLSLDEFFAGVPKVTGDYPTEEEVTRIVQEEAGRRFDDKTSR